MALSVITHDQRVQGALEDAHLRDVLAGEQVVVGVELEAPQVEIAAGVRRDMGNPAGQHDEGDQQEPSDLLAECRADRGPLQGGGEGKADQRQGQRAFGA
jgi:hypothetical protein